MSLRNKTINNIVKTCKFYKDTIRLPKYIRPWTIVPAFTYNKDKRCRQLEERSLAFHPISNATRVDNIYNYKNNEPLDDSTSLNGLNSPFGSLRLQRFPSANTSARSRVRSRVEPFENNDSTSIINIIIFFLIFMCLVLSLAKIIKIV